MKKKKELEFSLDTLMMHDDDAHSIIIYLYNSAQLITKKDQNRPFMYLYLFFFYLIYPFQRKRQARLN